MIEDTEPLLDNYRKALKNMGCRFRSDGTVLTVPYRDEQREIENERLRQAVDAMLERDSQWSGPVDGGIRGVCVALRAVLEEP